MKAMKASLLVAAGVAGALGLQLAIGSAGVSIGAKAAAQAPQTAPTAAPTFMPGPASVSVVNEPAVHAKQQGAWTVSLDRAPVLEVAPVQMAAPSFLHPGVEYAFTWAPGAKPEHYTVLSVRPDGWVLVEGATTGGAGSRWLNTARAIAIEQVD